MPDRQPSEAIPATPDPRAELRAVCEGDRDLGRTKSLLENHDVLDLLDALTAKDEELRSLRNHLAEVGAQLEWIGECVEGLKLSEFAESFPLIRAVADLKAENSALRDDNEHLMLANEGVHHYRLCGNNASTGMLPERGEECNRCRAEKAEAELRSFREASAGARELWKLLHWEREQVKPPDYYSPDAQDGWRQAMAQGRTILSDYEQHGIGSDAFALQEAGAPAATSQEKP